MSRNIKFSLIIAAVAISSCQAADKLFGTSTLAELFKRSNVQHARRGFKQTEEFAVKLVDGTFANVTHQSDGVNDTYSGYMVDKATGRLCFAQDSSKSLFDAAKEAFQQQEEDLSTYGISSIHFNGSLASPFDLAGVDITRWTTEKYTVPHLADLFAGHKISHILQETAQGKKHERFKAFCLSANSCSFDITQDHFIQSSKTLGAEHYSKEIYEANLLFGEYVRSCRTHKGRQDTFNSYRCSATHRRDSQDAATLNVLKSAFLKQAALRAAQAAKAEETKKTESFLMGWCTIKK